MKLIQERRERADQLAELITSGKATAAQVGIAAQEAERAAMIVSVVAIVALVIAAAAMVVACRAAGSGQL